MAGSFVGFTSKTEIALEPVVPVSTQSADCESILLCSVVAIMGVTISLYRRASKTNCSNKGQIVGPDDVYGGAKSLAAGPR
jgi:hypothetical protein